MHIYICLYEICIRCYPTPKSHKGCPGGAVKHDPKHCSSSSASSARALSESPMVHHIHPSDFSATKKAGCAYSFQSFFLASSLPGHGSLVTCQHPQLDRNFETGKKAAHTAYRCLVMGHWSHVNTPNLTGISKPEKKLRIQPNDDQNCGNLSSKLHSVCFLYGTHLDHLDHVCFLYGTHLDHHKNPAEKRSRRRREVLWDWHRALMWRRFAALPCLMTVRRSCVWPMHQTTMGTVSVTYLYMPSMYCCQV